VRRVCCCAPGGQEISIDRQQMRAVSRGQLTLGSWTQNCLKCIFSVQTILKRHIIIFWHAIKGCTVQKGWKPATLHRWNIGVYRYSHESLMGRRYVSLMTTIIASVTFTSHKLNCNKLNKSSRPSLRVNWSRARSSACVSVTRERERDFYLPKQIYNTNILSLPTDEW